jgi:hypothetical protein
MAGGVFAASHFVVGAARGGAQNKRPACAPSTIFCRVDPSTRGPTGPQRAQRVKFVVRSAALFREFFLCPVSCGAKRVRVLR